MIIRAFAALFVALTIATAFAWHWRRRQPGAASDNLHARIKAWWVMIAVGACAMAMGRVAIVILFAALAAAALVEFAGTGWWLAFVPLQFAAVYCEWYWLAWWILPLIALSSRNTAGRGLVLCPYALSWIGSLRDPNWIFWLVLVVQASDVLQFIFGRTLGRRLIAPRLSPSKTVEGLLGGVITAGLLGGALHEFSPVRSLPAALVMAWTLALLGFASGLLFSSIKRQRGLKDWGTMIAGHGGVLDRIDSLVLTTPAFAIAAWFLRPAA
jgi:phosphatidate cytidylyltransferase